MDTKQIHVELLVDYKEGVPRKQPVHVEDLKNGCFLILYSPGLVRGIAAGDTIRLLNEDGEFEIVKRSGNVCVQLFSLNSILKHKKHLTEKVLKLNGHLDGIVENGMVFTIPVSIGFSKIEKIFNDFVISNPGTEWYYGNVYDPKDMETPLNWWQ